MAAVTDLEGFTYLQREGNGVLLGVYEQNPRHWKVEGADWDFGRELFPEELDRIMPELSIGFERFPVLQEVGIKRWVNGAFTFTPDGNPLVGPVSGIPNYWAACGCMAGFSQCGGIGLAVANWIVDGDPGYDVFGMDVARFGPYASNERYLRETTAQFYARRFVMAFPNEELPAARPLKTTPCYDAFLADGARFTVNWGLEVPLYFAPSPDFEEDFTLGRSNAELVVADEVDAVRTAAGAYEIAQYARYEVTGPDAETWLDHLLSCRIPAVGHIRLAPMLNEAGRLMGDLTVATVRRGSLLVDGLVLPAGVAPAVVPPASSRHRGRRAERHGRLDGLLDLRSGVTPDPRATHPRGRVERGVRVLDVPPDGRRYRESRRRSDLADRRAGVRDHGPDRATSHVAQRAARRGPRPATCGSSVIGPSTASDWRRATASGPPSSHQAYSPGMSGLDRFVAFDKGPFTGCEAARREREMGAPQLLVLLEVSAEGADASGDEGIWLEGRRVGFVTSGSYGHHVRKSLALAYVDREIADAKPELKVHVVGEERTARILPEAPYDPQGSKLRDTHASASP